ncbi:MAG TPA: sigma-70 family RNA polymerase sigma factor [Ramlibacter sp.]|uniref:sigma-70 family RNA polymerase sigma factor n=1 Tax=Ramlibacter sp. TaxID=1917967 RepID=UPI002C1310C1|nr:sigma-70 family RNA polymerase sigma factor [Ramlibacter sp.]HVZ45066.1 sigma-70 family RNA polymerase sigma factor [Ramlibacter sp.]
MPDASFADLGGECDLWERWRKHGEPHARARLLDLHLPHAQEIAASLFHERSHDDIPFEDYRQISYLGLLEALDRFDASPDAGFGEFAADRIRDAIRDTVLRASQHHDLLAAVDPAAHFVACGPHPAPSVPDALQLRHMHEHLQDLVEALPVRQRSVIQGRYVHEQSFVQLAREMDITRNRISQLHSKALVRLRLELSRCRMCSQGRR